MWRERETKNNDDDNYFENTHAIHHIHKRRASAIAQPKGGHVHEPFEILVGPDCTDHGLHFRQKLVIHVPSANANHHRLCRRRRLALRR